jgi:hypothetical protein
MSMGVLARRILAFLVVFVVATPLARAERKLAKTSSKSRTRSDRVEKAPEVPPDHQGYMLAAGLGGGYAPGGAMVGLAVNGAYRWPWDDNYVEAHGDFTGALSGGSLTQFFLTGVRLGSALGQTGLVGVAGLGYRRVALGMPFGDPHVYHGAAFEGALYTDLAPEWRTELGIEMIYPAGGPDGADLVIGFGAHAQALYRFGDLALFGRYELLELHARFQMGSTDDASHLISVGVRSVFW